MARFKCPNCKENTGSIVKDSRSTLDGSVIRRRRVCSNCSDKFTTYETLTPTKDRYSLIRMEASCQTILRELLSLMQTLGADRQNGDSNDNKLSKLTVEEIGGQKMNFRWPL